MEKQYSDKSDQLNIHGSLTIEEKMLSHQKRIEEKAKAELEEKLNEFRESEFKKFKLENAEKFRIELENAKKEYELAYQARFNSLLAKEKNIEDLVKQRHDFDQREMFSQRQQLLEELKLLKDREMEFKRHSESQTKSFEIDLAKFKKFEDDFKKREFQLKLAENDFEQRLRTEREKVRFEVERSFAQREFLLQSMENKNKEDAKRIEIEKNQLDRVKKELQTQQIRGNELELELQKSRAQALSFLNENNLLKDKLSQCLNYDVIKEENNYLKAQMETIKIHLGENYMQKQNQIKQLPKSLATSKSAFKPVHHKRSVTFANENSDNQNTSAVILPDSILATGLTSRDDDSALELGDRLLTVADNQLLLEQKIEDQNLNNNKLQDLYEMQIYESRQVLNEVSDLKTQMKFLSHGIVLADENEFIENFPLNKKYSNLKQTKNPTALIESVAFLESAKERLKQLDSEAEKVEKNYRDYQYRLTSTSYPVEDDYLLDTKNKNNESFKLNELLQPFINNSNSINNSSVPNESVNNKNNENLLQLKKELSEFKNFSRQSSLKKNDLFSIEPKVSVAKPEINNPLEPSFTKQESFNKASSFSEAAKTQSPERRNSNDIKPIITRNTAYAESSDESSKHEKISSPSSKPDNKKNVPTKYYDSSSESESLKNVKASFDAQAYMTQLTEPSKYPVAPKSDIESKPINKTQIVFEEDSETSIKNEKIERESLTSDDDFNF